MRLNVELRAEQNLPTPTGPRDSQYRPIERTPRHFAPLQVPRRLHMALPFESKPKDERSRRRGTYMASRAVVLEKEERQKLTLMQQLATIRRDKETRRVAKEKAARAALQIKRAKEDAVLEEKQKRRLKRAIADQQQKRDHEAKKSRR